MSIKTPVVITDSIKKLIYITLNDLKIIQGDLKSLDKKSYEKFKKQLIEVGFASPFHVWFDGKKYDVLDGTTRYKVLKMMAQEGILLPEKFPAVEIIASDIKTAKKILLGLASNYAKMTDESLSEFAIESDISLEWINTNIDLPFNSGINVETSSNDKEGLTDTDEVPDVAQNIHGVVLGQIWKLGDHRLMCGDSTSIDAVDKLMNSEKAELCFTSPPYSDQREYNGNKDLSTEYLATFIRSANNYVKYFVVNLGYSRKNGEVNTYWDDYIKEAKNCGLKLLSWNIWDKGECGSIGNQTAMFGIQHEWIFVFGHDAKELNKTVANKNVNKNVNKNRHGTIRQKDGSLSKIKNPETKVHEFSQLKTIVYQTPLKARNLGIDHPAMFPVEFPEQFLEAMTNNSDGVYDPFGGSGSTLIACEKTNRKCFMMELDPHYCSIIIERWKQFTGKTPELISE